MEKAIIVRDGDQASLDNLNLHLDEGWLVGGMAPMGPALLVILESFDDEWDEDEGDGGELL